MESHAVFFLKKDKFLIFILCAKVLTPHDLGIYSYILTITNTLIVFGDFGFLLLPVVYVTEYNLKNKKKINKLSQVRSWLNSNIIGINYS
jgi:O-antigen/teichoic acid export membrane protein